jgi:Ca2+-binding RTX toxin-like protein
MFEVLETRRLLAASIDGSGNLIITGSAGDDTITVTLSGVNIVVDIQPEGFNQSFAIAAITGGNIGLNADAGNDLVDIADDVTLPADIRGGAGNDTLRGGGGDDQIRGEDDADLLDGRSGADLLVGDGGVDILTYQLRLAALNISFDGTPNDGEAGETDNIDESVDIVIGGAGNDTMSAAAAAGGKTLYGFDGNDTLTGSAFADRLHGGGGNDSLEGGDGDDVLLGTIGADVHNGGAGNDTVTFYWAFSSVTATNDGTATSGTAREQDTINTDVENMTGSAFNDTMTGNAQANLLRGLGGNDTITGGAGLDTMFGGLGDDSFFATDGEIDTIDGEGGTDTSTNDPTDVLANIP